ncbi:NAD(P)/FAD-dependent oxidoreductase [Saccharolobus solfataricus]|uniref:NADH:ubiquinone reductase (non-electrogenic) n=2 Tax=Saccharolobus solfataricus TaxID=2287 RepID=Q97UP4_SACS2|nr:NAD(P)/FAD-dependent oxidoreductase [Saccharolobus solfataricus]AAK43064.1 NADH dehydrogenase [Saccharolobus solfataricus P2]QPG50110.1 NAD(P)/FAD-dependent oxidoreductase [Saccharolobus solfataricus]SAI86613.1 NADH dehydrogenase [Saccharolobus solfataricus]
MRVVIVGGGFAGIAAKSKYPNAILIDRSEYFLMTPKIVHTLADGESALVYRKPDIVAEVVNIKFNEKKIITNKGEISYDKLIISLGYSQDLSKIKGANEHVMKLESFEDAIKMHNEIEKARTLIVIGGGDLGVEVVGSTIELVSKIKRKGKERVILINRGARILPHMPPQISLKAENILAELGVEVILDASVEEIRGKTVITSKGEFSGDHIFYAGGIKGSNFLTNLKLSLKDGKINVNEDLSSVDYKDVYGAGVCASTFYPSNAEISMQSGVHAILNAIEGRDEKFKPMPLGDIVDIDNNFMGVFMGLPVRGNFAKLLKRIALAKVYYTINKVNFYNKNLKI